MKFKAELMDADAIRRSLIRITHEIIEKNRGTGSLCLLGIKRRGLPLAERIRDNIRMFEKSEIPLGYLDITLYRDDLSETTDLPRANESYIPTDLDGKHVILVDDVIYTGRTVRAAIEAVFSFGRPASVQLAVLVDRGHRELPIRPDFVGKNVPTSQSEVISVCVSSLDGKDGVDILEYESNF